MYNNRENDVISFRFRASKGVVSGPRGGRVLVVLRVDHCDVIHGKPGRPLHFQRAQPSNPLISPPCGSIWYPLRNRLRQIYLWLHNGIRLFSLLCSLHDNDVSKIFQKKGAESSEKNSFYKKMSRMVDSNPLDDVCDGFERASSGGFAFLWDEAVISESWVKDCSWVFFYFTLTCLEYQVLRHKSCAITRISDSIMYGGYGIALQQGSEYRDKMSRA